MLAYGWLGRIDDVRLSAGRRYAAAFAPAPTLMADRSTLALWSFEEGTGATAAGAGAAGPATLVAPAGWIDVPACAH